MLCPLYAGARLSHATAGVMTPGTGLLPTPISAHMMVHSFRMTRSMEFEIVRRACSDEDRGSSGACSPSKLNRHCASLPAVFKAGPLQTASLNPSQKTEPARSYHSCVTSLLSYILIDASKIDFPVSNSESYRDLDCAADRAALLGSPLRPAENSRGFSCPRPSAVTVTCEKRSLRVFINDRSENVSLTGH